MSLEFGKLCSHLLLEHFGEIVEKVGSDLFKWGTKPASLISLTSGVPLKKVKEALTILIHYGFVGFNAVQNSNRAEYYLMTEKVYLLIRYPRYLFLIKTHFGDEAEIIVEEVLRRGQENAAQIILHASSRLKESKNTTTSLSVLRDKFMTLVRKRFLMKCPSLVDDEQAPALRVKEKEVFLPPDFDLKTLVAMEQDESKVPPADYGSWTINPDRFHQEFRDQIMISAITRRVDEMSGELLRLFLKEMYLRTEAWVETSNPIPYTEIREACRRETDLQTLHQYLDQYIKIMEEDPSKFISKVCESAGGQFTVNIKLAFKQLAWSTLDNFVLERFGSKAARIFRLIRIKKFVEQEQIQELAMIPAKEAKMLTYKLLEENFIQMQELRKSMNKNVPNKTFFLFYIDLNQVVRMVVEICYKALYNAITRREYERQENKRTIEKQQRIESIAMNLKEQGATPEQLAEIEEMLTPPEQAFLEKVRTIIKRLNEAELQIDETIFLLQLYLKYH